MNKCYVPQDEKHYTNQLIQGKFCDFSSAFSPPVIAIPHFDDVDLAPKKQIELNSRDVARKEKKYTASLNCAKKRENQTNQLKKKENQTEKLKQSRKGRSNQLKVKKRTHKKLQVKPCVNYGDAGCRYDNNCPSKSFISTNDTFVENLYETNVSAQLDVNTDNGNWQGDYRSYNDRQKLVEHREAAFNQSLTEDIGLQDDADNFIFPLVLEYFDDDVAILLNPLIEF